MCAFLLSSFCLLQQSTTQQREKERKKQYARGEEEEEGDGRIHGFAPLFASATKILSSAGAKSARVGDFGFSSASDFIFVPLPLVKVRESFLHEISILFQTPDIYINSDHYNE
ncbi:hypothetical protein VNO78_37387 [Psophocarpus tetragonolobus]|uniref:Uncharacterized protein n=1 Tax=Psophocarpus tetragonolobus TaxID=3891 RepID=A0AAN9NHS5_PSOTE